MIEEKPIREVHDYGHASSDSSISGFVKKRLKNIKTENKENGRSKETDTPTTVEQDDTGLQGMGRDSRNPGARSGTLGEGWFREGQTQIADDAPRAD